VGWPALLRGRKSISLEPSDPDDLAVIDGLLAHADVVVHSLTAYEAKAARLDAASLTERFPRLVAVHITGWGTDNQWSDLPPYEALVYAKTGVMHAKQQLTPRPGPAYVSTPYISFGAGQAALQGTFAALLDRETTGRGQAVETSLLNAMTAMDTWTWFSELVLHRYPGAFEPTPTGYDELGRPNATLIYALLIAVTSDGKWLQFAQVAPRLMQAWLKELDLLGELADPKWKDFPAFPTAELRGEWWQLMIDRVRQRSSEEWAQVFANNDDINAEHYRTASGALEHPQLVADGRVVTLDQPGIGEVKQAAPIVFTADGPLTELRPAPLIGENEPELRALAATSATCEAVLGEAPPRLPLEGVTIVEFGLAFAGPYGATLMTDLGARVIKVEATTGDQIRLMIPFPEAGAAKVLQGKEDLAIDANSPEGREVVKAIVREADVVLQCMRSGAAERLGVGEEQVRATNPDVVYVNATGYGLQGPYSHKPSYAPVIAAAMGVSDTDSGGRTGPPRNDDELREGVVTLHAASTISSVQADSLGAVAAGTAIALGVLARARGTDVGGLHTTMVGSVSNVLGNINPVYDGKAAPAQVDDEFWGTGPLHRIYPAADGFVFLAASGHDEWARLVAALTSFADLSGHEYATPEARTENAERLAQTLASVFVTRAKADWERELRGQGVGLVEVVEETPEWVMQTDPYYEAGFAVDAISPIFDEHRRIAPLMRFSRSLTQAKGGCTLGQHTDALLTEFGFGERIAELRDKKIVV
jgi:crotonobetainyl-CoA:carnitine CoA-transferase CaiB-like acyl-CoA transferase